MNRPGQDARGIADPRTGNQQPIVRQNVNAIGAHGRQRRRARARPPARARCADVSQFDGCVSMMTSGARASIASADT